MTLVTTLVFFMATLPTGVQITIWTAVGAVALKAAEHYFDKHTETVNDRKDYREEIKELRERVDKLEKDVEDWRTKFYAEQERVASLRNQMIKSNVIPDPHST